MCRRFSWDHTVRQKKNRNFKMRVASISSCCCPGSMQWSMPIRLMGSTHCPIWEAKQACVCSNMRFCGTRPFYSLHLFAELWKSWTEQKQTDLHTSETRAFFNRVHLQRKLIRVRQLSWLCSHSPQHPQLAAAPSQGSLSENCVLLWMGTFLDSAPLLHTFLSLI